MTIPDDRTEMSLAERFTAAVHAVGGKGATHETFARLTRRYAEPHRHYHTLAHVEACVAWLDRVIDEAERPAELVLALFFHDAVYDGSDDEARSAALAVAELGALGVAADRCARVAALIGSTAHHQPSAALASDRDVALMIDIDLAILGAPPAIYAAYAAGVRAEHPEIDDATFRWARAAFVRGMLERHALFHTAAFAALEPLARANLTSELLALDSEGSSP